MRANHQMNSFPIYSASKLLCKWHDFTYYYCLACVETIPSAIKKIVEYTMVSFVHICAYGIDSVNDAHRFVCVWVYQKKCNLMNWCRDALKLYCWISSSKQTVSVPALEKAQGLCRAQLILQFIWHAQIYDIELTIKKLPDYLLHLCQGQN